MRASVILLALSAVVHGAVMKRQTLDAQGFTDPASLNPDMAEYGILVSPGPNPIPRTVDLKSEQWGSLGSKRVKVRYGPFRLPLVESCIF
jgi:hypothetical protein